MTVGMILTGMMIGHTLASFLQTILHRVLGHSPIGAWLQSLHIGEHHSLYSGDQLRLPRYHEDEKSLTLFYLIPAGLLVGLFYWLLPADLAIGASAGVLLSYWAHSFLHAQFHLTHSRLERVPGFRKLRALHMVHHRQPSRNFAVIDLYWDRLMGTFSPSIQVDRKTP